MNWLSSLMHKHTWLNTGINPYGVIVEQACWCGEFQHHLHEDLPKMMGDSPNWRPGRHPDSVKVLHRQN